MFTADFRSEAETLREQLVAWRRDLHQHPELSLQEERTAALVADRLRALGYEVRTGVAGTGVIGLLSGRQPGPVVAARFDMDALPIQEQGTQEYVSLNPGVMHACGHDAHVAIGLGVATLLAAQRDELRGAIKLLFQPAEEALDGAERMIAAGALEDPHPDVFLAAHLWDIPVGQVDVSAGPVMAAAQAWSCTVRGHGGHGAKPQLAVDPIVAAAQAVVALQSIVARNVSPLDSAVMTVGEFHAGSAPNIIPPEARLSGTLRSYTPEVHQVLVRRLRQVLEGVAAATGAEVEVGLFSLTPAVVNDPAVTAVVRTAAVAELGAEHVSSAYRTMGSEDASFFMERVPGCYFFLGAANPERGLSAEHHTPDFAIDEGVLPIGVAVMAQAIAHYVL